MSWSIFGNKETYKKVTQKDIDLIRVEAEAISSTDDKVYLMEELHKHIEAAETALKELDDPKTAPNVKQTREELLRLRENMEEVRKYIIDFQIPQKRYGLFIKYPKGFEG